MIHPELTLSQVNFYFDPQVEPRSCINPIYHIIRKLLVLSIFQRRNSSLVYIHKHLRYQMYTDSEFTMLFILGQEKKLVVS